MIQQVTADFWDRWATEVTPQFLLRQKWHEDGRDLKRGDVVLIHDSSAIKGRYIMGVVEEVVVGKDDRVRSCSVAYVIPSEFDSGHNYSRGRRIVVKRSIQRLTLLLPVEDQEGPLEVFGNVLRSHSDDNAGN